MGKFCFRAPCPAWSAPTPTWPQCWLRRPQVWGKDAPTPRQVARTAAGPGGGGGPTLWGLASRAVKSTSARSGAVAMRRCGSAMVARPVCSPVVASSPLFQGGGARSWSSRVRAHQVILNFLPFISVLLRVKPIDGAHAHPAILSKNFRPCCFLSVWYQSGCSPQTIRCPLYLPNGSANTSKFQESYILNCLARTFI